MSPSIRNADVDSATGMLLKGATREQVERALSNRRLSGDRLQATLQEAFTCAGYGWALRALEDDQTTLDSARALLEQHGLDKAAAAKIIEELRPLRPILLGLTHWSVQALSAGQAKSAVQRKLPPELPPQVAKAIVYSAHQVKRAAFVRAGVFEMLGGCVLALLGVAVNYTTYWIGGFTGTWYLVLGFFVFGLVTLAHGFAKTVAD